MISLSIDTDFHGRPLEDWIIDSYLKAVPDLTIYKAETSEAVIQLTEQMESKDKEVEELRKEMNIMHNMIENLVKDVNANQHNLRAYQEQFGPRSLTKSERWKEKISKVDDN